jgi:hypothetical protein
MASGGVKRNADSAADASDLQISKMNSFVFSTMMKNDRFIFFVLIISKGNMPSER